MLKINKTLVLHIFLFILVLVSWLYFGKTNNSVRLFISDPISVVEYIVENCQTLSYDFFVTLQEAVYGLIIAILASAVCSCFCLRYPKLIDFVTPIMVFSQVIPLITLAPFFIIFFGIGPASKVAMAAVVSFFPIFVNFIAGYKQIPSSIIELKTLYNIDFYNSIVKVYLPLSLRNIMAGIKISSSLAVIGAIVGEFSGAERGIGYNLLVCTYRLEPDLLMANLLLSITLGSMLYGVIILIENSFGNWYNESEK